MMMIVQYLPFGGRQQFDVGLKSNDDRINGINTLLCRKTGLLNQTNIQVTPETLRYITEIYKGIKRGDIFLNDPKIL